VIAGKQTPQVLPQEREDLIFIISFLSCHASPKGMALPDAGATFILSNPDEVGSVEGGCRGLAQHDWLSSKHKNIYLKSL
jgi:hypothetical protein